MLLFAVAFGLSTDYGVFLLVADQGGPRRGRTRTREAVAVGLERTGRIVTAAALLFAIAIGAFVTSQIVFIKELGFGTALAVLIDATIIRALLVPSLMELLGEWNWWAPAPLRRLHGGSGSPIRERPAPAPAAGRRREERTDGDDQPGRFTARTEGDFVVFLIGMRINRPLRVRKWWPVFTAMPRMIRELEEHPEKGMMHAEFALIRGSFAYVQYWRSFEHLARFARRPRRPPPAGLDEVQPGGAGLRRRRHLARDLQGLAPGSARRSTGTCPTGGWQRRSSASRSAPRWGSRRPGGSGPARPTRSRCRPIRTPAAEMAEAAASRVLNPFDEDIAVEPLGEKRFGATSARTGGWVADRTAATSRR